MRRIVLILMSWLVVIAIAVMHLDRKISQGRDKPLVNTHRQERYPKQVALLRQVESQYQQQHYTVALSQLVNHHDLYTDTAVPAGLSLSYYLLKGKLHWALWEYVEAERAWREARQYARTTREQEILSRLARESQQVVSDINRERNNRAAYLASPDVGPAGVLRGRIVLIYLFVVDGGRGSWSLRDRDSVMSTWHLTQAWLKARAWQYGHSIQFVKRTYLINRNPQIRRLELGDATRHFRHVHEIVNLAAKQLGFRNLLSFTDRIKREEQADEAMVLIQLARDGRSFAFRCMHRCPPAGEFAVLMESPRRKKWQALQYAQAHESLHLFGADDLYNIRGAKYYDVRDIMNYPSSVLQASTLDPLTAWAVGLEQYKPDAPFPIKTYR